VLVVEDDEAIRSMLAVLLEQGEDFAIELANDGLAALKAAAANPPAVVVLDLRLPRMDGLEVARRLRADPHTRMAWIVAISAHAGRDDALASGCDEFLTKPLDIGALETAVRRGITRDQVRRAEASPQ
jgi:two-component system cell cycle response regulator DivK